MLGSTRWTPVTSLIRRLQHMCFPMNFPKFSGAFFYRTSVNDHIWMFSISWFFRKENFILKATFVNQKYMCILELKFYLKLVSAIFYEIFIYHQMIALQKLWKMLFISSRKLFSFSRYSHFYISVFPSFSPCQLLL